jgi:hypothetical protein
MTRPGAKIFEKVDTVVQDTTVSRPAIPDVTNFADKREAMHRFLVVPQASSLGYSSMTSRRSGCVGVTQRRRRRAACGKAHCENQVSRRFLRATRESD